MKFESLLNDITKTRGGKKAIDDKHYIEWGKSLETIVDMGNKSMIASAEGSKPVKELGSGPAPPAKAAPKGTKDAAKKEKKETPKKEEPKKKERRQRRRRMRM